MTGVAAVRETMEKSNGRRGTTILLADRHPDVRSALRLLLEQEGHRVTGEAAEERELLRLLGASRPSLVLLDWEIAGGNGQFVLSQLRHVCPGVRVVVLSGRAEVRRDALAAGADGFVSKSEPPERLLGAVAGTDGEGRGE